MKLAIAQLGQPVLRQAAAPVAIDEFGTAALQLFVEDMRDTLVDQKGAGLAAPQVFAGRRIFLGAIIPPQGDEELPGLEVFINPRIVQVSAETGWAWEGCLSFPELLVLVRRHRAVRVEYVNIMGQPRMLDLADLAARIVQHELDHLDGILTLDRAPSTRHIIKASEIDTVMADNERSPAAD